MTGLASPNSARNTAASTSGMIHTATAAKRMRRLPSRLAVRRQRKKSRISRNGAITRKMSTIRAARGSAASEKPA